LQSKNENALSILETVLASLKITSCELFWDENIFGKKPKIFAVYSFEGNMEARLSSSDEAEVLFDDITLSVYIKPNIRDKYEFRNLKVQCKKALCAAGFFVSDGYEAYEKETGLKRFDLELNYFYNNESED